MVGCSAVNCTNRSDKGFKTYRIPRDPIRRQRWIRFIGREGWIPGSGASVCEAHFESSAYELHRADGLKKLKQNAVPTISVSNPSIRSKRKQTVRPRLEYSLDEGCNEAFIAAKSIEEENSLSAGTCGYDFGGNHEESPPVKKIKTVHVMSIVTKPISQQEKDVDRGRTECHVTEKKDAESSLSKNIERKTSDVLPLSQGNVEKYLKQKDEIEVVEQQPEEWVISNCVTMPEGEFEIEEPAKPMTTSVEEHMRCFVCSKVISPGFEIQLNVPTEASRTHLNKCLDSVLSLEVGVGGDEVVCRRCCSLLNYIDRTEAELAILKGAISTCTEAKKRLQQDNSDLLKSEQILDRFSRGLGERSYMLNLEELFLETSNEENIYEENAPSQPVGTVDMSCRETHNSTEMLGIIAGEGSAVEPVRSKRDEERAMDQYCNAKEIKKERYREAQGRSQGESSGIGDTIQTESKMGETMATCSSETDKIYIYSASSGRTSCAEDLKNYLGGEKKIHQCKICSFKTVYDSVMIWHLRVHMRVHRWCDFCTVPIPVKESMFEQLKKAKAPKSWFGRKSGGKHRFILPAVPVESVTVPPLSSLDVPLLMVTDVSSESPVVLVDTQDLGNKLAPETVLEEDKAKEDCVKVEESQNVGAVITSKNILLEHDTEFIHVPIPSASSEVPSEDKHPEENYVDGTSLTPVTQENEPLEIYCGILTTPVVERGKVDSGDVGIELGGCLGNLCDVDGGGVVGTLDGEHCNTTSNECVHASGDLEDSIGTNFLDTLTSQPDAKYSEILPEICDEVTGQNTVPSVSDVPEDNINNTDDNFARNNSLGDLALAYENSVAALMCQSDDSDGMLY